MRDPGQEHPGTEGTAEMLVLIVKGVELLEGVLVIALKGVTRLRGGGVRGLWIGIQAVGNYCNQAGRKAGAELAREECDMLHLRR